jgi:AraC family transcriptional regulator, ethanolamine operon transcriptional activator
MNQQTAFQELVTGIETTVQIFETDDPAAVSDGFETLEQDVVKLEKKPFQAKRLMVSIDGISFLYQFVNHRLRINTKLDDHLIAFAVFGQQTQSTFDGRMLTPEWLVAVEPGATQEFVMEPGHESITCLISPDKLRKFLDKRGRMGEFRIPCGLEVFPATDTWMRAIFKYGKRLIHKTAYRTDLIKSDRAKNKFLFQELLNRMLVVFQSGENPAPSRRDRTRGTYGQIVRQIQSYAMANIGQPTRMVDFCKITGVSERTLQHAFHEFFGLSPFAYLSLLRLHRVRQTLRTESRATTTVTAVASEWGFWQFGEFSRIYKKCFGELPSDTLLRQS